MPHTGGAYSFARAAMGPWGGSSPASPRRSSTSRRPRSSCSSRRSTPNGITTELLGLRPVRQHVDLVGRALRRLHRAELGGSRDLVQVRDRRLDHLDRDPAGVLGDGAFSGAFSWDILCNIEPDAGQLDVPAARRRCRSCSRCRSRCGSSSASRSCRSRRRRRTTRCATSRAPASGRAAPSSSPACSCCSSTPASSAPRRCGVSARAAARRLPRDRRRQRCAAVLALFALIGLLASLQGIMFAYGRNMYSLSRAGYYPKFLSLTGKRQTPWVALVVGAVIGFIALVVLDVLTKLERGCGWRRGRDRAEHRGLGRGARLPAADDLVHHPAPEVPERQAALQEPVGHAGCRRSPASSSALDLPRLPAQPDVPAGDHRDRDRLRA